MATSNALRPPPATTTFLDLPNSLGSSPVIFCALVARLVLLGLGSLCVHFSKEGLQASVAKELGPADGHLQGDLPQSGNLFLLVRSSPMDPACLGHIPEHTGTVGELHYSKNVSPLHWHHTRRGEIHRKEWRSVSSGKYECAGGVKLV